MKNIWLSFSFLLAGGVLLGCNALGQTPLDPQQKGSLFASVSANYSCRKIGTSNGCVGISKGSKMGKTCMMTILSLITFGDKSVEQAMTVGGMKTVNTIDYSGIDVIKPGNVYTLFASAFNVGLFTRECVIVTGE